MSADPLTSRPAASRDPANFVLQLNTVDDLFNAPEVNPFSPLPVEILGQSGLDYLHARTKERWPRQPQIRRLTVQLPPSTVTSAQGGSQLAQQIQAAVQRTCQAQISANRQARRLAMGLGRRKLLIALPVTLVALALLAMLYYDVGGILPPGLRGILIVVALFAASIAIWDALEALIFDWAPFMRDNRAYRCISELEVVVEAQAPETVLSGRGHRQHTR